MERLQATGATADNLTTLVRGMQARLLFDLCYLLGEPSISEPALFHLGWALVETTDDQKPAHALAFMSPCCRPTRLEREMRLRRREG